MDLLVLCEYMYLAIIRVINRVSWNCIGAQEELHLINKEHSGFIPLLENKNEFCKCGLLLFFWQKYFVETSNLSRKNLSGLPTVVTMK